jgi:hypothetical protein
MKDPNKMDHGSPTELIFARRVKDGDHVAVSATRFDLRFEGPIAPRRRRGTRPSQLAFAPPRSSSEFAC